MRPLQTPSPEPAPEAAPAARASLPARLVVLACGLAAAALTAATVGGHFAAHDWRLDLLRQAPHALLALALLVAAIATVSRAWLVAAVALAVAGVNGFQARTWFLDPPRPPIATGVSDLRVIGFDAGGAEAGQALGWLVARDPDALGVTHASDAWLDAAEAALPGHRLVESDAGPVAFVRSDIALRRAVASDAAAEAPRLDLTLDAPAPEPEDAHDDDQWLPRGTTPVRLLVIAPPAPTSAAAAAERDAVLAETARLAEAAAAEADVIVLGGFRAAPGSVAMTPFANTPLREAQPGRGQPGTWPASLPAWASIPLDRALVTEGVTVLRAAVGPDLGAAHRPLLLELAVAHRELAPKRRRPGRAAVARVGR